MGPGMTPQMDTPTKDAKFSAMDSMMVCLEVYRSRLWFLTNIEMDKNLIYCLFILYLCIGHLMKYIYSSSLLVGRRGCDRMVVEFITTYAISAYHH